MTKRTQPHFIGSATTALASLLVLVASSSCRTPPSNAGADVVEVIVETFTGEKASLFCRLVEERNRSKSDASLLQRLAEEASARIESMPDGDEKTSTLARRDAFLSEAADKAVFANKLSRRLESEFGVKPDSRYRFDASTGVLKELVPASVLAVREEEIRAEKEREVFARAAEALAGKRAAEAAAREKAIQTARTDANAAWDAVQKARLRTQAAEKERETAKNAVAASKQRLADVRSLLKEASSKRSRLSDEANKNRREAQRAGRRLERLAESGDFEARLDAGRTAAMARSNASESENALKRAKEDEEVLQEAEKRAAEEAESARVALKEAEKETATAFAELRRAEKTEEEARRTLSETENRFQH